MRRIYALALVPLVALAACSSPAAPATTAAPTTSAPATSAPATSASASASTDAPANTGEALSGTGYTLTMPEGWVDATDAFKKLQPTVDTGGKDGDDTKDGFNDNVNVIVQSSSELPLEQLRDAIKTQLENAGSTDIEFKENIELQGRVALQVWSTTKGAGGAHTIQYMTFNDGKLFVITVSTNLGVAKAEVLAQQILAGWQWA